MRALPIASRILACVACVMAATAVVAACVNDDEFSILDTPFDGGFLGACSDAETRLIPVKECPAACVGPNALATCVGMSFGECSCIPSNATMCDSGCCPTADFQPQPCKGKVVALDPSENQCDAEYGYIVCNGTCYPNGSFVCEIPPGYTLTETDGGHDAGPEAASDAEAGPDAGPDADGGAPKDGPTDVGSHEGGDAKPEAGGDAKLADAPPG